MHIKVYPTGTPLALLRSRITFNNDPEDEFGVGRTLRTQKTVVFEQMGIRGEKAMGNSRLIEILSLRRNMIQPKRVDSLPFSNVIHASERTLSVERRCGEDRRKKGILIFSKYWLTGKREVFRREEDSRIYDKVDRYSPKTLAIILIILMLSTMDAIFTLELINKGATELNPIMAYYLNHGPLVFFWVKYTLTCASTLLIFFNQHLYIFGNRVPMKVLYLFMIIPYALVVQWELYLIFTINYK